MNVLDFIPHGIKNAVSMKELSKRTGKNTRTIRKLIFNARLNGALICSTCDERISGYFLPNNPEEATLYVKMQRSRIRSAHKALKAVVKYIEAGESGNE